MKLQLTIVSRAMRGSRSLLYDFEDSFYSPYNTFSKHNTSFLSVVLLVVSSPSTFSPLFLPNSLLLVTLPLEVQSPKMRIVSENV